MQKKAAITLNARPEGDQTPTYPCVSAGTKCSKGCCLDAEAYGHPIAIVGTEEDREPKCILFVQV